MPVYVVLGNYTEAGRPARFKQVAEPAPGRRAVDREAQGGRVSGNYMTLGTL